MILLICIIELIYNIIQISSDFIFILLFLCLTQYAGLE
jgi:hypothetical protein